MAGVQDYLLTVDSDKEAAAKIAEETSKNLQSKAESLIEVVQSLGEYINDENPSIRAKASSYLTAVITALPPKFLSRQQIQVLCQFFCDRLEDGDGIAGVEGLEACAGLERFGGDMVQVTARAVFANLQDLQLRSVGQRYRIYQLVNGLMESHRKALHEMGNQAVVGMVDFVGGEKDPKNLMLVFSMLKVIMVEWDISDHVETVFHSVFCYFPITFRPPPNDPYGITAQDLKNRLRDCLASNSKFAPYLFPDLFNKLDTSPPAAKKDIFQTFKACALSYDSKTVSSYSVTLWDTLKYEILNAQEEDLAEEALPALRAIAERLSENSSTAPTSPLAQYLRPIMKECNESLREPQQKQAKPTGKIVSSLAAASAAAYYLVIKAALAPLLTIYQDTDGLPKQRSLLEVLVALFDSAIEVFGSWRARTAVQSLDNPLDPFHDRLQELFSQALMSTNKEEVSFRMVALKGLLRLASIRNFLQENEIGLIVQYLNEIVLLEESYSRDELKQEGIKGLAEISKAKPQLIKDITFPIFMSRLPDSDLEPSDYITTLEGLAQISVEKDLFNTLIRRLLNKLDIVLNGNSSPAYPRAILSTILYLFKREGIENDPNLDTYYSRIVEYLFHTAASPMAYSGHPTQLNNDSVVDVLGSIGALIVHSLPKEKQKRVSNHVYELFCPFDQYFEPDTFFVTRQLDHEHGTMALSTYLLAALPRDLYPPQPISDSTPQNRYPPVLQDLFDTLFLAGIKSNDARSPATILAIHRQLALLVNKFMLPSFTEYILKRLQHLTQDISSSPPSTPEHPLKIRQTFHLARALICRLIPETRNLLYSLLDLVCNSTAEVSIPSAHGFALLLAEDPILIPKNGFTIRLLFKQKVFTTLVPEISQRFRAATAPLEKSNLLIALSGILANTPQSVILPELTTLLPLLLQSLDLEVEDPTHSVKNATIETLTLVVREAPTAIDESGHTTSLVTRLLKTASPPVTSSAEASTAFSAPSTSAPPKKSKEQKAAEIKEAEDALKEMQRGKELIVYAPIRRTPPSPPPHTRLLALMLLSLFPTHLKQTSLLPLKAKVLRGLERCADDPKRNVRRQGVICRSKWLGMDEPEEEEEE